MENRKFVTDFNYVDRESKSEYVWRKYQSVLQEAKVLDVGADECHLRKHLSHPTNYIGIGMGGHPDKEVNLELDPIPFEDRAFDTVLCLDVLEHLANPHQVYGELCRVSKRNVIISLPNPWGTFWNTLCGPTNGMKTMKYYGLPKEAPIDRHKWFFSTEEAEVFIRHQAPLHGFQILQIDRDGDTRKPSLRQSISQRIVGSLISKHFDFKHFNTGTIWAILQREPSTKGSQ